MSQSDDGLALEMQLALMDGIESGIAAARQVFKERKGIGEPAAVKEETFNILTFDVQKGERLGDYATASKKNNIPDKWTQAFNILRQANATINNRYHSRNYEFAYWIYQERIFRQKLKTT
jgi:hypothetical protein